MPFFAPKALFCMDPFFTIFANFRCEKGSLTVLIFKKYLDLCVRVRTVLNEKQLHTLRTCYQANPRPDALMKEQLVEMTGLSPRVIRVWFQNKR